MPVRRFLLILTLLAAAVPAAASAQDPVPATPPVATTGAAESITLTGATLTGDDRPQRRRDHLPLRVRHLAGLRPQRPRTRRCRPTAPTPSPSRCRSRPHARHRSTTTASSPPTRPGSRAAPTAASAPRRARGRPRSRRTASRDVTSRGARLITTVDPNGLETTVRFEYGRTTRLRLVHAPRQRRRRRRAASRSRSRSAALRPHTRYHFRAVATNSAGTTRSLDRSFVTAREPTGISIALTPSRVVWSGSMSVIGRVAGTGGGRHARGARAPGLALQRGLQPGRRHAYREPRRLVPLRPPVDLRDDAVARRHALGRAISSAVRTASSARQGRRARAGRRPQALAHRWARSGRACPAAASRCRSARRRGHWAIVRRRAAKPLDANRSRYRFSVKRKKRVGRYRVVVLARDGGAHVPGRSREVRVRARRAG